MFKVSHRPQEGNKVLLRFLLTMIMCESHSSHFSLSYSSFSLSIYLSLALSAEALLQLMVRSEDLFPSSLAETSSSILY